MKLRCLIVDDVIMARKSLTQLCAKREELEVVSVCENGMDALSILQNEEIDVLFLDVEMPEMTGLELLNELPYTPYIILTTSKTEYAFDAYQYNVFDYLKKPISYPRFSQTIDKIVLHKSSTESTGQSSLSGTESGNGKKDIYIKVENRYIRILFDQINYIESIGDYVKIHLEKENHVVHTTMKNIEEKLNADIFLRIHRTYIINLQKIIDIEENSIAIGKVVIPVSRNNKQILMDRLNLL
ncbi:MAG: LytTR family DNA-binding domain-containing protein [Bacteroidia bacterium]|nr:LytTR family DNA-binding domain-containing protein [Bacteroidia bacterium]